MRVIYCNNESIKESIYYGFGYRMGYATKNYFVNGKVHRINPAFSFVFECYLKDRCSSVTTLEEGSFSYFFLEECKENYCQGLRNFLDIIFKMNISNEEFKRIKGKAKSFKNKEYKNERLSVVYKAYEVIHISKDYKMSEYIKNIENITYDEFLDAYSILINTHSTIMVINTGVGNISDSIFDVLKKYKSSVYNDVRVAYKYVDRLFLRDSSIMSVGRNNINIDILSFRFEENINVLDKLMYFYIELTKVKGEAYEKYYDEYDCGLIILQKQIKSTKELYRKTVSEEEFLLAKNIIMDIVNNIKFQKLYEYMRMVLWLSMLDIRIEDVEERILNTSYETYRNVAKRIRPIVVEAQIVIR